MLGGLGAGLVALWFSAAPPAWADAAADGAGQCPSGTAWAAIPAYLQAYRGSHVVISTIMFNFPSRAAGWYLLVNHLRPRQHGARERGFAGLLRTCPAVT